MFDQSQLKLIKNLTQKPEMIGQYKIMTDVSVYLNTKNNKKYAVKKKIIPMSNPKLQETILKRAYQETFLLA